MLEKASFRKWKSMSLTIWENLREFFLCIDKFIVCASENLLLPAGVLSAGTQLSSDDL
jgi:hypothetical protein